MSTALIIGASRGIGHELARQYKAEGWRVIATARKPENLAALSQMGIEAHQLDVTKPESIAGIGWKLDDEKVDVAWLVAGVYGPREQDMPTQQVFDEVMHTNVLAAMHLLPIVAPLVVATQGKLGVLSSNMGSISYRVSAGGSVYRASKAALNSVLKDASITWGPQGATLVAFHPGWVRTSMGGEGAPVSVEESAAGLRQTMASINASANGTFLNYDGSQLSW
jgi:NAD(P)-dependent dehydrogenase (short-subunit alcohol dehydrogenase family)